MKSWLSFLRGNRRPATGRTAQNPLAADGPVGARTTHRKTARSDWVDPETLMQIQSTELRARYVVEGFLLGLHRSPYHGFSVEFTEYREYSPGDDPRYIDWKLNARSDRYFIKRFEDETNLRCQLLLDVSRSMVFGSVGYTKLDYACTLAATLSCFLLKQRDAVGLITFDEQLREVVPPRFHASQMHRLLTALERPVAGSQTRLELPLTHLLQRRQKRGLIVVISDMLSADEAFVAEMSALRASGHELAIFQILDPQEIEFRFETPTLFADLESGREIDADPWAARAGYRAAIDRHLKWLAESCREHGTSLHVCRTDWPLERALASFLLDRDRGASGGQHVFDDHLATTLVPGENANLLTRPPRPA